MSDNMTFRGFVGSDLEKGTTPNGLDVVTFRMGVPERRYSKSQGTWVDAHMNWFTVQCYRHVADNVISSVKKGQRIIVIGKLRLHQEEINGRVVQRNHIKVETIGHDLMWGKAEYWRTVPGNADMEGMDDE